ncbi:hypothetical protein CXF83_12545 [Shewanella sp. Choline-02u-19]|jgi:hypothetical protein|nr:hypothetical protein CXF82_01080 [Shewanella sp. GutDb-MelDb]PKG75331.1 hypothetical protein CXF86_08125 [Shewanella sp. GutCb]PKH57974.1 hypothetical protein CXF84_06725 [Shewanella sp. Bg11-22]PKI27477.1 hypothetical protein CXF83_12545 [Shewanella sp. Choline-02u-19]
MIANVELILGNIQFITIMHMSTSVQEEVGRRFIHKRVYIKKRMKHALFVITISVSNEIRS